MLCRDRRVLTLKGIGLTFGRRRFEPQMLRQSSIAQRGDQGAGRADTEPTSPTEAPPRPDLPPHGLDQVPDDG